MADKKYVLVVNVTEMSLGSVLSAVTTNGGNIVSLTPAKEPGEKKQGAVNRYVGQHYKGGKRDKGISGRDLVLKTLRSANRAFAIKEVVAAFVEHGFAEASTYPVTYDLVKAGKVRALGEGKYVIVEEAGQPLSMPAPETT